MTEETCVLCNAKLQTKEALQNHFRKHANKEIDSKGRPIAKIISASDIKPAKQQANKAGPRSPLSLLKSTPPSEKTVSSGSWQPIKCDFCEVLFESVAKAISHRWKAHPNQPSKFFCSHCGKHFPLKAILDNHLASQHKDVAAGSIVKCEDCGGEFFNQSALDYHAKITHKRVESVLRPVATPPPSKKIRLNNAGEAESVYYCHLCGSEYILKFNLRKHLEVRHADEDTTFGPETEIIRCTVCEAVFCNKKAYDVHNMYHLPDDMYVTSEEHRLRTVSRVDQDFDLRRVQIHMPKSVRGLAKHHANMVWNASFNRHVSNGKPQSIATENSKGEDTLDHSKSPSKGKAKRNHLKEKKTSKRKRSNSSCDVNSCKVTNKQNEIEENTSTPPRSPSKAVANPIILKESKTETGVRSSRNTRSNGKTNSKLCIDKDEKKIMESPAANLKDTSNLKRNERVLRSRASKC